MATVRPMAYECCCGWLTTSQLKWPTTSAKGGGAGGIVAGGLEDAVAIAEQDADAAGTGRNEVDLLAFLAFRLS
jgi:hypothetical protein